MPRSCNIKKKFNLSVICDENEIHNSDYCSLKEISAYLNFPYSTITDIYQNRRVSLNKYEKCKYFPRIAINLLS